MSLPMNISHQNDSSGPEPAAPRVQELDWAGCWEVLNSSHFARLGTSDEGEIDITPVNIVASDERIYLRTAAGTKLTRMQLNPQVAVEVDRVQGGEAVSVILRGTARLLTDTEEIIRAQALPLRPWLHTEKLEFVEITPQRVTGRRFRLGD